MQPPPLLPRLVPQREEGGNMVAWLAARRALVSDIQALVKGDFPPPHGLDPPLPPPPPPAFTNPATPTTPESPAKTAVRGRRCRPRPRQRREVDYERPPKSEKERQEAELLEKKQRLLREREARRRLDAEREAARERQRRENAEERRLAQLERRRALGDAAPGDADPAPRGPDDGSGPPGVRGGGYRAVAPPPVPEGLERLAREVRDDLQRLHLALSPPLLLPELLRPTDDSALAEENSEAESETHAGRQLEAAKFEALRAFPRRPSHPSCGYRPTRPAGEGRSAPLKDHRLPPMHPPPSPPSA